MLAGRECLFLIFVAAVCSGCVTAEGVMLGPQPYIDQSLVKYGRLHDIPPEPDDDDRRGAVTGLIVVGTLSAFRELTPENAQSEYRKYAKAFESWQVDREPHLGLDEFAGTMKGWTRIKVLDVPLLFAEYERALVPNALDENAGFKSAVTAFLFQASGDLVAATTNSDGAFVVESLLCEDSAEYYRCARNYKKGIFDATTGVKLDLRLRPSKNGPQIDPTSFRIVSPSSSISESRQ